MSKQVMKVLHLAYSDDYGGASVAMKRIHRAIADYSENVTSEIAVVKRVSSESHIISLSNTFSEKLWVYLRPRLAYKLIALLQKDPNSTGRSVNIFPSNVNKKINSIDFDILHLHWIGNETIRIESFTDIRKPILWTFHDMWAMLGAEHTNMTFSERFIEGYSKKNRNSSSKGLDIDRWTWERKFRIFNKINITPVAVSLWQAGEIKKSKIWNKSEPIVIPNPINIHRWAVGEKKVAREVLKVSLTQKVIAFGAVNAFSDKLKGYDLLKEALLELSANVDHEILLIVFGDRFLGEVTLNEKLKVRSIGFLKGVKELNTVYTCADVVAIPSYVETFGQVAIEAIVCGTPVVAFNTSGLKDIIRPGINGYLSDTYSILDMADKIKQALQEEWNANAMRQDIQHRFSDELIAGKYTAIYRGLLKQ